MRRPTTWVVVLSATALPLAAVTAGAGPAGAAASSPPSSPGYAFTVTNEDPGGSARSLRTPVGRPLARPAGVSASAAPADVAKAVVRSYASSLQTGGATFRTESVRGGLAGGSLVRLQQTVGGVPVMGGEAVLDLDAAGNTRSASTETLTELPASTVATISAAVATQRALASVDRSAHGAALVATRPELSVYDPRIFGADGLQRTSLVWKTTVTSSVDPSLDHLVLVDALHGVITLDLDETEHALNRIVCDQGNNRENTPDCVSPVRSEGDPVVGSATDDINLAYDYAGATYDFYQQVLGRNSIDDGLVSGGAGMPIKSTVRYCDPVTGNPCPNYPNAFWDGTQMYYGSGFANADDVVAHELTHGVTQFNNGLYYYFQSGAINESLSDIFGEYVDQWDAADASLTNDLDGTSVNWKIGEDLIGFGGAIRNMADPHLYGQPDRMGDTAHWESHPNYDQNFDAGGVHTNSGVGNKFGYLIGRSAGTPTVFNNRTVTALGIPKAAEIVYGASKLLTSGADYRAFATALRASCSALVGAPGAITPVAAADCTQVDNALLATQMDQPPAVVGTQDAGVCPTGTVTNTVFSDDMEGPSKWTRTGTGMRYDDPVTLSPVTHPLWYFGTDYRNPYGVTPAVRHERRRQPVGR